MIERPSFTFSVTKSSNAVISTASSAIASARCAGMNDAAVGVADDRVSHESCPRGDVGASEFDPGCYFFFSPGRRSNMPGDWIIHDRRESGANGFRVPASVHDHFLEAAHLLSMGIALP